VEHIERATIEDIPQLAELLKILFSQEADFQPDREKQIRGLRLIVEAPERGCIFLARVDCHVVGMVSLLFTVSTAEGAAACWLEDMIVRPEHRRNGLGSRLLQHAVNEAKAHGFARITLLTDRGNADAIRFYQRHGFQLSEMLPLRLHL
jgi:GNAT superfamily N-acetyltransferase